MELLIYMILGYWATGQTIYKNRILIGTAEKIFLDRVITGFILGPILIPWAVLSLILRNL